METADNTPSIGAQPTPRVFIYGSCASRDAFEFDGAPTLVNYRARSSVASAFGEPTGLIDKVTLDANPSPFQKRMVASDLRKDLSHLLSTSSFDFLLIDFIDERLRLIRSDRGYNTYSPELSRMGFRPTSGTVVEPGADEHLAAFAAGWARLLSVVPEEKIVVARAFWATLDDRGGELENPTAIRKNNQILSKLYDLVEASASVRFIDYADEDLRADSYHRWGPAPYHYPPSFHHTTLAGIQRLWIAKHASN